MKNSASRYALLAVLILGIAGAGIYFGVRRWQTAAQSAAVAGTGNSSRQDTGNMAASEAQRTEPTENRINKPGPEGAAATATTTTPAPSASARAAGTAAGAGAGGGINSAVKSGNKFPHSQNTAANSTAAGATDFSTAAAAGADSLPPRALALLERIPAQNTTLRAELLALATGTDIGAGTGADALTRATRALAALPPSALADPALHIHPSGAPFYVCTFPSRASASTPRTAAVGTAGTGTGTDTGTPAAAPVLITAPPIRHSKPGSKNILLLDFSGLTIEKTLWNEGETLSSLDDILPYHAKPFDLDGDLNTFSDTEQQAIIAIWERVAEDYAPFDVDITTEPIPADAFTRTTGRALVTHSKDRDNRAMPGTDSPNLGGIAYVNVFGEIDYHESVFIGTSTTGEHFYRHAASPALIYYDRLNNNPSDIAYTISHEFGHNLGLSHDGPGLATVTGTGADFEFGYYGGHGSGATSWAPIMGNGYGYSARSIVQWSKGEYKDANNHEDDIAIIAGKLGHRGEIVATSSDDADALTTGADGRLGAEGVLLHTGDAHYYSVNLGAPASTTITLNPFRPADGSIANAGNTDLRLELLGTTGAVIASDNPVAATSATLSRSLAAGQWLLRVTSTGVGDPLASNPIGYTAYGSIGQYTLATNLVPSAPALDVALAASATAPKLWWLDTNDIRPGSSAAPWFGQAGITHDGLHAAQSGSIASGTISSLGAFVEGSGTLAFWWKIASHEDDSLALTIGDYISMGGIAASEAIASEPDNGNAANANMKPSAFVTSGPVPRAEISGSTVWLYQTITVSPYRLHRVEWTFFRNGDGDGAAYLDQVAWMPDQTTFAPVPASLAVGSGAGSLTLDIDTNTDWLAGAAADWLAVSPTSGTGPATLTVSHDANPLPLVRSGTIVIWADDYTLKRTTTVTQSFDIPLAEALDAPNLAFTTGGDAQWFAQKTTARDTTGAARAGIIRGKTDADWIQNGSNKTWLQTTVTGTGILAFWWKTSSEQEVTVTSTSSEPEVTYTYGDILHFYIDGTERARLSGAETWTNTADEDTPGWRLIVDGTDATPPPAGSDGWNQLAFTITSTAADPDAEPHTLRWQYEKDPLLSVAADTAWLDQVQWQLPPALTVSPTTATVPNTAGTKQITITSNISWLATITTDAEWLTHDTGARIIGATGNVNGTLTLHHIANPPSSPERTATIEIAAPGTALDPVIVTITQAESPATPTLTVSQTTATVPIDAGTITINVATTTTWTAAVTSGTWLRVTANNAAGTLIITHAANTSGGAARTGKIRVTAPGATGSPIDITITQPANQSTTSGGGDGGGGGGGGGAASLWSLAALALLFGLRSRRKSE
jgi:hypothetical protein